MCAWEILTLGEEPYGDMSGDDVLDLLQNGGSRLAQPINFPDVVYEVLQRCWSLEPRQRPDFPPLLRILDSLDGSQATPAAELVTSGKTWAAEDDTATRSAEVEKVEKTALVEDESAGELEGVGVGLKGCPSLC